MRPPFPPPPLPPPPLPLAQEVEEEEEEDEDGSGMITRLLLARFPILKKWLRTNGPTDGQTNRRTDKASYRDAWTHRKRVEAKP